MHCKGFYWSHFFHKIPEVNPLYYHWKWFCNPCTNFAVLKFYDFWNAGSETENYIFVSLKSGNFLKKIPLHIWWHKSEWQLLIFACIVLKQLSLRVWKDFH